MKSLVEEASSVVKAIEKAWNRAGCPQTFSVKVFETPETNFFGFTKKSAKVGIFFEEEVNPQRKYQSQGREQRAQNGRSQSKGRNDNSAQRREDADDLVQVESRRAHHNGRQPQQGQRYQERSQEQRPSDQREREKPQAQGSEERSQNRDRQRPSRQGQSRQQRNEGPRHEQRERQPRYENDQESSHQQPTSFEPREDDGNERPSQDQRHEQRSERRDDRRGNSRGGDRDRRGRGDRPRRAQRHEFDEQRPLFNEASSEPTSVSEPTVYSTESSSTQSLVPQKKVLKVSGRRYSAPVKKTEE